MRRQAEALATPKTARADTEDARPGANLGARAAKRPHAAKGGKTNGACVADVDDVDDAANRKKAPRETATDAGRDPPAFEPGEPHPGSRRRLERAHKSSPASVAKKSPANVTSASLVRTPAPAAAGGRTRPGSGDSRGEAPRDRGGADEPLSRSGPPPRARGPRCRGTAWWRTVRSCAAACQGDPGAGRARVAVGRGRGRRGGRAPPEGLGVVVNADDACTNSVVLPPARRRFSLLLRTCTRRAVSEEQRRSPGGPVMPSLSRVFWSSGTYRAFRAMARYES